MAVQGRIVIDAHHIPHISIEKITSRKDVSFRGRKIVADFVNDRARLEIDSEPSNRRSGAEYLIVQVGGKQAFHPGK